VILIFVKWWGLGLGRKRVRREVQLFVLGMFLLIGQFFQIRLARDSTSEQAVIWLIDVNKLFD
jgi:hypothetical protein